MSRLNSLVTSKIRESVVLTKENKLLQQEVETTTKEKNVQEESLRKELEVKLTLCIAFKRSIFFGFPVTEQ